MSSALTGLMDPMFVWFRSLRARVSRRFRSVLVSQVEVDGYVGSWHGELQRNCPSLLIIYILQELYMEVRRRPVDFSLLYGRVD